MVYIIPKGLKNNWNVVFNCTYSKKFLFFKLDLKASFVSFWATANSVESLLLLGLLGQNPWWLWKTNSLLYYYSAFERVPFKTNNNHLYHQWCNIRIKFLIFIEDIQNQMLCKWNTVLKILLWMKSVFYFLLINCIYFTSYMFLSWVYIFLFQLLLIHREFWM